MAANGRGIIDFLTNDIFGPTRLNAMLEQFRVAIENLTWADIKTNRPFEAMVTGEGTFAGPTGVVINHTYGAATDYVVFVTPLGSSSAKLGEFWVEKGGNSITVKNTGEDVVSKFQYIIIKK